MRAPLLALLALVACRATTTTRSEPGDVYVPKMPVNGASDAHAEDAPSPGTAEKGWLLDGEQSQPQYADRALVIAAMKRADHRAVVVLDEKLEECSSTGGSHVLFTASAPASGQLHFGGHGVMLQSAFAKKGDAFVVAYTAVDPPESIKNDGWCVPDRSIVGRAVAVLPVADAAEGQHLLDQLGR